MRKFKRALFPAVLAVLALALVSGTALAAWDFAFPIYVNDTGGTGRTYVPVLTGATGSSLVDSGYMSATGTDTNVRIGNADLRYMLSTTEIAMVVTSLSAGSRVTCNLYTGYSPVQTDFDIITGTGGYVTVADADALELGGNFEIEQKGYVDTSAGSDKNLVYKEKAFRIYVSAEGSITAVFPGLETYNPDEHVETSSVDGWVRHFDSAGISWASIVGAAGDGYDDSDGAPNGAAEPVGWRCDTTDEYDKLVRSILLFDTSALPDGCTVTSAVLSLYGQGKENGGSWTTYINIYSSNPASNIALEDADYATLGTTAFSDSAISYDSWSVTGYNDFALNSSGIAGINKTGVSKFGARTTHDATATDPGWTVEGNGLSFQFYMAEQGAGYKPKLVINYKTAEVTATGVSSGVHTVKTIATGGGTDKLEIWVGDGDGTPTLRQSEDLNGASVPDNDNDWIIMDNSTTQFFPYMEHYKHTVSSTEVVWYQPTGMITATALPDRDTGDGTQNGTITWGNNSDLTVAMGAILSYEATSSGAIMEEISFETPEASIPSGWFGGGDITGLPFYQNFTEVSSSTGMPVRTIYIFLIFGVALAMGFGTFMVFKPMLFSFMVALVVLWAGSSMQIVPGWIIFAFLVAGIGIIYMRRQV